MTETPLDVSVSVIIPTYNRADLVERCIQSLHQSNIAALEIIVVDDGGTDRTPEVARSHGAVYVRQANAGPAAARNNGFSVSHGRFVSFIDSDDEWVNGGVSRLLEQMQSNPDVDVAFADSQMGNETDGFASFIDTYGGKDFAAVGYEPRSGDVLRLLDREAFFVRLSTRNVMFLGSMLIRRRCFEAVGGFDDALRGAADWDFFMRATCAGPVAFSPGPAISKYYKHDAGMSTDSDHMDEDFIKALDSVRRRSPLSDAERIHVDARLRAHVFGWAWKAYNSDRYDLARQRLLLARSLGQMKGREFAYFLATFLPGPVVRAMRHTKQSTSYS